MPREDDQDLLHGACDEELRQATDLRSLLDTYASREGLTSEASTEADWTVEDHAPEAIAALRDVADYIYEETSMRDARYIYRAITTAIQGGQDE